MLNNNQLATFALQSHWQSSWLLTSLSGLVNWMVSSQACNTSRLGRFYRDLIQWHRLCQLVMMPRSKKKVCFFSVTVPKNRVGRSVKCIFLLFFCSKCVCLYMLHVDWELFPVTEWKNTVGRSVKYKKNIFFCSKCEFHAYFMLIESWEDGKHFMVGIFLSKNLF